MDIWYQVVYEWEDNFLLLNFVAYRIESTILNNENQEVPHEINQDRCLEGAIKFDGCMNVIMQKGYSHFCGRNQTKQYGELFNKLYDKAKEIGCDDE